MAGVPRCGGGSGSGGRFMRLPPGFRFHPTDEELLEQYLRKKVHRRPLPAFRIPEVELSRYDPWDLPSCGCVSSKEWYVFCLKGGVYRSTSRSTRAAATGYWKVTGKERQVTSPSKGNRVIGARKTLVFYRGRHPHAQRTDWTMHEYHLAPSGSSAPQCSSTDEAPGLQIEEWVLCRIFDKRAPQDSDLDMSGLYELRHARNQIARFLAHRDARLASLPTDDAAAAETSCVTELSGGSSQEEDNSISSS